MFYDRFIELCDRKKVSRTKACVDCGVSRTAWHKWEDGATPNGTTINKFATYFDVSVGYLLGEETEKAPAEDGKRKVSDEDIMFALFRGRENVTEEMYEEVRNFADYVALREEQKKRKSSE